MSITWVQKDIEVVSRWHPLARKAGKETPGESTDRFRRTLVLDPVSWGIVFAFLPGKVVRHEPARA